MTKQIIKKKSRSKYGIMKTQHHQLLYGGLLSSLTTQKFDYVYFYHAFLTNWTIILVFKQLLNTFGMKNMT